MPFRLRYAIACLVTICCLAPSTRRAGAQENLPEEVQVEVTGLKMRVDDFFRELTGTMPDAEGAVRALVVDSPLQNRNDEISRLIDQSLTLDSRYGAYTGHEMIDVKPVGSDLIFLKYLYKGERYPIVWHFAFYRTTAAGTGLKRDWWLISLRFDSKIEALAP